MAEHDRELFTLLSSLLQYPDCDWLDIKELRQRASELPDGNIKEYIDNFLYYIESKSIVQLAEQYVTTFDFSDNSNLDLTSLLCPDDRKRGQVLATLKSIYQETGLAVESSELPDYLPMILEFWSMAEEKASQEVLDIVGPGMNKLCEQLKTDSSPYAAVLEACLLSTEMLAGLQTAHAVGEVYHECK